MTATADAPAQPASALTPNRISRLRVPALEELSTPGVSGFFARQQREEGLTSNWFRALSLNEGDLERLNGYLLPLLGTDGRGGLSAREREVIATVVSGRTGARTATATMPTSSARWRVTGRSVSGSRSTSTRSPS
jgi:alkylhydroperoxidase family enzyme